MLERLLDDLIGEIFRHLSLPDRFGSVALVSQRFATLAWTLPLKSLSISDIPNLAERYNMVTDPEPGKHTDLEVMQKIERRAKEWWASSQFLARAPLHTVESLIFVINLTDFVTLIEFYVYLPHFPNLREILAEQIGAKIYNFSREDGGLPAPPAFILSKSEYNFEKITAVMPKKLEKIDFTGYHADRFVFNVESLREILCQFSPPNQDFKPLVAQFEKAIKLEAVDWNLPLPKSNTSNMQKIMIAVHSEGELRALESASLQNLESLGVRLEKNVSRLPELQTIPSLTQLEIHNRSELAYFNAPFPFDCKGIRTLVFRSSHTPITLDAVQNLESLEKLTLDSSTPSDLKDGIDISVLKKIKDSVKLRKVDFKGTFRLSDFCRELAKFPLLTSVTINSYRPASMDLSPLKGLEYLKKLKLVNVIVDRYDTTLLKDFKALTSLWLGLPEEVKLVDEVFEPLCAVKTLRSLTVMRLGWPHKTYITRKCLEKFANSFPEFDYLYLDQVTKSADINIDTLMPQAKSAYVEQEVEEDDEAVVDEI